MSPEVEMVIQMVDKVVKPLLHIQEEMALINTQFNRLKEEWGGLNYQSLELYERWQAEEQSLAKSVAELMPLSKVIQKSSLTLTALESQLDAKIYLSFREASKKLIEDFRRDTFAAVKQEVNDAAKDLATTAKEAKEGLETYQTITFFTHFKYFILAAIVGLLTGAATFFIYFHGIKAQPPYECECVLQKIEGKTIEEVVRTKS